MSHSEAPVDAEVDADIDADMDDATSRREAVRLSTVFGGRVCQHGKAYACTISDVSLGGAKVRLKDPSDYLRITQEGEVQLIFERLSDYKALNTVVAWVRPGEHTLGLRFIDPELRRRVVIKRLMPTRWRVANEGPGGEPGDAPGGAPEDAPEDALESGTGEG